MKLHGFVGKGSGKLGSSVFAICGGEQIVRQYNPQVSNPQTAAQTEQRAKFKLLSQLAAVFAGVMAFAKDGLTSARNKFVSANMPLVQWEDDTAQIDCEAIKLTPSAIGLPNVTATRGNNNAIALALAADARAVADDVIYVLAEKTEESKLRVIGFTKVGSGANGTFAGTLQGTGEELVAYAYGIKFATAAQRNKFNDYMAQASEQNAVLEIVNSSSMSGASFTETKGITVAQGG